MKFKTFDVKASADGAGFTGYASVFDNEDAYGDVMRKGAFVESLAEHGKDGAGVPVYWGHRMDDPMMNIGITTRAVEDDHGLLVEVKLGEDTEVERQVRRLLLEERVKQMSFAFDYLEAGFVDTEKDGSFYEVRKVRLHEVSVVPVGANQETEILSAKAAGLASRSQKDAAAEVLAEAEKAESAETVTVTVEALRSLVDGAQADRDSADARLAVLATLTADADESDDDGEPDPAAADASDAGADPEPDETPKSVTPAMRAALALRDANLNELPKRGQEGVLS